MALAYQSSFACAPLVGQPDYVENLLALFRQALEKNTHLRLSFLRFYLGDAQASIDTLSTERHHDFYQSFDTFLAGQLPTVCAGSMEKEDYAWTARPASGSLATIHVSEGLLQAFQRSSESASRLCPLLAFLLLATFARELAHVYNLFLDPNYTPLTLSGAEGTELVPKIGPEGYVEREAEGKEFMIKLGHSGYVQQKESVGGIVHAVFDRNDAGIWAKLTRVEMEDCDSRAFYEISIKAANEYLNDYRNFIGCIPSRGRVTQLETHEVRCKVTAIALPKHTLPRNPTSVKTPSTQIRTNIGQHSRARPTHLPDGTLIKY